MNRDRAMGTAADAGGLPTWTEDGPLFVRQAPGERNRQLDSYLLQLEEEGYLTALAQDALLSWDDLYRLLKAEEHSSSRGLLNLPPVLPLLPQLVSEGALSDLDFRISIQGWKLAGGRVMPGGLDRTGALVRIDGREGLLPEASWQVLLAVRELVGRQREAPSERSNQLGWAKIRKLAKSAGAGMDGFLTSSVVLTPERLGLALRKAPIDGVPVIEVMPQFDDQPQNWLRSFDALGQVQDRYHVVEPDGSVTHVLIAPEVKAVLESVKRMPGRRAAGDDALQWLRNPYAVLGTDAVSVIDAEEFERGREEAEIFFHHFQLEPCFTDDDRIDRVLLHLDANSPQQRPRETLVFQQPHEYAAFVAELEAKMAAGFSCGFWQGYELELSDFRLEDLEGLRRLLERWQREALGDMLAEVFDLSLYGARVVGFGPRKKPSSPFIGKEGGEQWLPDELLKSAGFDPEILNKWDTANRQHFEQFCERLELAKESGQARVVMPGLEIEIPVVTAERIREAWAGKFSEVGPGHGGPVSPPRGGLNIEDNIEGGARSDVKVLPLAQVCAPRIPASLRHGITLHPHQQEGLAWLQNLHAQTAQGISGCVLADDMGLGKTIQLLSFIAGYLEDEPSGAPVLIVAPVSLLDNWQREFERFFHTAAMPMLKLYGDAVASVKLKRADIPAAMQAQGIRNLLRPGWVGGARIVLTTYETLRDQEISLARQQWRIVVCDEAQKIKNPAALVTQAAKALKADFCVACTGTPVENSLTDLWCLFDFVQPGLLGPLNDFGRAYRRPIECKTDEDTHALEELRALIKPQLLRRTKQEVAELPPKREDEGCRALRLSSLQESLYRSEIARHTEKSALLEKAGERNIAVLGLLHTLKLVCAHPHAIRPEGDLIEVSPKMRWLLSQLERIRAAGEKVIIFTELRDIQRDVRLAVIDRFGLTDVPIVNGDTSASSARGPNRQGIIDAFQAREGFGVIILSTTAVGFGVNVQAANHVIHFTRPWNPAKEDQATDRAYRIGQTRPVHVYYPTVVSPNYETFEHKLDLLLGKKRALAGDMLNGADDVGVMELADSL